MYYIYRNNKIMKNLEKQIIRLYDEFSKLTGYGVDTRLEIINKEIQEKGYVSRNFASYHLEEMSLEIHNYIQTKEYLLALYSFIYNYNKILPKEVEKVEDILNKEYVKSFAIYEHIREWFELEIEYKPIFRNNLIHFLEESNLFTQEELNDENIPENVAILTNRALYKNIFKSYKYRQGDESIYHDEQFQIYPQIGIGSDLESWLRYLENQNVNNDMVYVAIYLNIDELEEYYSSFYITIHKGNSIWLSTDNFMFKNPHNREAQAQRGRSSGKFARVKEEAFSYLDLPYRLIFERKETSSLVKSNNIKYSVDWIYKRDIYNNISDVEEIYRSKGIELLSSLGINVDIAYSAVCETGTFWEINRFDYKQSGRVVAYLDVNNKEIVIVNTTKLEISDIKTWDISEKVFTVTLVDNIIKDIMRFPDKPFAALASSFMNQKKLTDGKFSPDDSGFSGWKLKNKEYIEELTQSVDKKDSLLPKPFINAIQVSQYTSGWLAQVDDLENMVKWCVLDKERSDIQKKLNKSERNFIYSNLDNLFVGKETRIYDIISQANEIYFKFKNLKSDEEFTTKLLYNSTVSKYSGEFKIGFEDKKQRFQDDTCKVCNRHKALSFGNIQIRHYKMIMFLLGIKDRNELPRELRNYRSQELVPAYGNQLLDNTHPYSRLTDPLSHRFTYGLNGSLFLCGHCLRKINKNKKYNRILIDEDFNIEVLSDDYKVNGY